MHFSKNILNTHRWVPRRDVPDLEKLKKQLTFRSKYPDGPTVKTYRLTENYVGIPMCYNPDTYYSVDTRDNRSIGEPIHFDITSGWRQGQKRVVRMFERELQSGTTNFLIEAPTSMGKTYVGIRFAHIVGRATLVLVYKSDLLIQWRDEIVAHTNLTEADIGIAMNGKADWKGKKFVIGLVLTLGKDFGREFKKYFGLVLIDEVDRTLPPREFGKAIRACNAKYRVGFSATLDRPDGLDKVFRAHLEEKHIVEKSADKMTASVVMHHYNKLSGQIPEIYHTMARRTILLKQMSASYERNALIAKYVKMLISSDRKTVVVSEHRRMLYEVREILLSKYGIDRKEIHYYAGQKIVEFKTLKRKGRVVKKPIIEDVSSYELHKAKTSGKVLLATAKMFFAGTSIPDVGGMVIGTPFANIRQLPGRIERLSEGKKYPIVVDIVDSRYKMTRKWGLARLSQYKTLGLPVRRLK